MRPQPTTSASRPQPARWNDEWSEPPTIERRDDVGRQQVTWVSPHLLLLLQMKEYSPTGVVKILQEKEQISDSNQPEI